jgi:hypothetical protein
MRELDRKLRDLLEVRRRVRQRLRAWGRRPAGRAAVCPHLEASAGRLPAAGVASRAPRRAGRAVGRMAALQGGRGCLEPAPGRGKRGAARPAAPGRER